MLTAQKCSPTGRYQKNQNQRWQQIQHLNVMLDAGQTKPGAPCDDAACGGEISDNLLRNHRLQHTGNEIQNSVDLCLRDAQARDNFPQKRAEDHSCNKIENGFGY